MFSFPSEVQRAIEKKIVLPERRVLETPVGMQNLGATCYANSLLQIWFHNVALRSAILNWQPSSGTPLPARELLLQVQRLFAYLSLTDRPSHNPVALLDLLNLSHHEQQV